MGDITQSDVVKSLVTRLRDQLSLNERQCYRTIHPLTKARTPPGDWWVTVSAGEGYFDAPLFEGGGRNQLSEDLQVTVTGYSRVRLDSTGHDEQLLDELERGLFHIKRRLLDAVAGIDLLDADGNPFLREFLVPRSATRPEYDEAEYTGWISIVFSMQYDWELT